MKIFASQYAVYQAAASLLLCLIATCGWHIFLDVALLYFVGGADAAASLRAGALGVHAR